MDLNWIPRSLGSDDASTSEPVPGWQIALAIGLAIASAIAAGLTLGLMTFDVVQLRILMTAGRDPDADADAKRTAKFARRIHFVRKRGNLLLVTLLLVNVAVNSAFSIIMGNATTGLVGFMVSTGVITVFGEILPQAICVRYGLPIGWFFVPLVVVVEIIMLPLAFPLAAFLDWVLGQEIGKVYNKRQLELLLYHHEQEARVLAREEMQILGGGLHIGKKTATDAMTPLRNVFGLDVDSVLDYPVSMKVFSSGFSRIPVVDYSKSQCIVGVLLVKDLLLLDPTAQLPIRSILKIFGRPVYAVDVSTSLMQILTDFKKGHTHIAVVRRTIEQPEMDSYYVHVGILTLEDIIEEILQDEIHDEFEAQDRRSASISPRLGSKRLTVRDKGSISSVLIEQTSYMSPSRDHSVVTGRPSGARVKHFDSIKALPIDESRMSRGHALTDMHEGVGNFQRDIEMENYPKSIEGPLPLKHDDLVFDGENYPVVLSSPAKPNIPKVDIQQKEHASLFESEVEKTSESAEILANESKTKRRLRGLRNLMRIGTDESAYPGFGQQTQQDIADPHMATAKGPAYVEWQQNHLRSDVSSESFTDFSKAQGHRTARLGRMRLLHGARGVQPLTQSEILAVRLYLMATLDCFKHLGASSVDAVFKSWLKVEIVDLATVLYAKNVATNVLTLVLQGRLKVIIGEREQFETTVGAWTVIGAPALPIISADQLKKWKHDFVSSPRPELADKLSTEFESLISTHSYSPEYSASVSMPDTKILSISKDHLMKIVKHSILGLEESPQPQK